MWNLLHGVLSEADRPPVCAPPAQVRGPAERDRQAARHRSWTEAPANGHIDTVPLGLGSWRESPWSGTIRNGRQSYRRGSFEMKGAWLRNSASALPWKRPGIRLGGDLLCESVVDEEWAGGGGSLAARLRGDTADACAIGEVSGLSLFRATRGGHFFEIIARAGDPARYFSREEVVGPAVPMGRLLAGFITWLRNDGGSTRGRRTGILLTLRRSRFLRWKPTGSRLTCPGRTSEGEGQSFPKFLPHEDVEAVVRAIKRSFREVPPE